MHDVVIEVDKGTKAMLLDLFTEVAILDHLVEARMTPAQHGVDASQFGVLNFFCRLNKTEERLSGLAWCFQIDVEAMRARLAPLLNRGLVSSDGAPDPCIRVTESGRAAHKSAIMGMAPLVMQAVGEIPMADLQTTARTLTEIRRTLDNLPDR